MSTELITLRMASREVDYRQRVCEDAVKFATSAKQSKLPRYQRDLKKAQAQLGVALDRCKATGISYSDADLPRAVATA